MADRMHDTSDEAQGAGSSSRTAEGRTRAPMSRICVRLREHWVDTTAPVAK